MKRKEAKKYDWFRHDREDIEKHIDKIYDDFESRTCENCKHYIEEYTIRDNHCGNSERWGFAEIARCTKDFGCNKFKRKQ